MIVFFFLFPGLVVGPLTRQQQVFYEESRSVGFGYPVEYSLQD